MNTRSANSIPRGRPRNSPAATATEPLIPSARKAELDRLQRLLNSQRFGFRLSWLALGACLKLLDVFI